jgi:DNA-binding NarL/FixJ family response regulator
MATILLIGEDEMLLYTRAAVLRKTGAEVLSCDSQRAIETQADCRCELVVLCHSVSEARSASLAAAIRERWPETAILQVTSDQRVSGPPAGKALDARCSWEPERLIRVTAELLQQSQGTPVGQAAT